ncbi:unnamed protein product [Staurois parvus]|uniref:Uncharacterized protein n=1 Tax=Staurois parvus TaxID=386267 RepID=A0ABN9CLG2_9NEOB|nr:unnamed protein product [Staurois parvus]
MIGTSYRCPVRRSVFHCVPGERAQAGCREAVYKRPRPCSATVWPFICSGQSESG